MPILILIESTPLSGEPMLPPLTPLQSAAYGSVLGALVGDAAGAVLEFIRRLPSDEEVASALMMPGGGVFEVAPGQITDDGELTIALAHGLAECGGRYKPKAVVTAYVDWAESHPFDIGNATIHALGHGRRNRALSTTCREQARRHNAESKANGALMRITPLAISSARWSVDEALKWARYDTEVTHPNASCVYASTAYALAIRHLVVHPGDAAGALQAAQQHVEGQCAEVEGWLADALAGALPNPTQQAGFVRHGFTQAFFHLSRGSGFQQALEHTLRSGGDSDTNACIVGGMVGAAQGIDVLMATPSTASMVRAVLNCETTRGQPRPERWHAARMIEHLRALC